MLKKFLTLGLSIGLVLVPSIVLAADQNAVCEQLRQAADAGHFLSDDQQDYLDECFPIPPGDDVTNFVPLIGPALGGLAGLGALLSGTGSTSATSGTD